MIKFDDRFSFERDKYGWILYEFKDGKDKNGNPKKQQHQTYYADLNQVGRAIVDRAAGGCASMEELTTSLRDIHLDLAAKFSGVM